MDYFLLAAHWTARLLFAMPDCQSHGAAELTRREVDDAATYHMIFLFDEAPAAASITIRYTGVYRYHSITFAVGGASSYLGRLSHRGFLTPVYFTIVGPVTMYHQRQQHSIVPHRRRQVKKLEALVRQLCTKSALIMREPGV